VTTAARYADAVPWVSLRAARDRETRLALLLNRVPPGAEEEIVGHLGELLDAEGLSGTTLFVLPEAVLDGQGLLSEELVEPIGTWLGELAGDPSTRVRVVGDTLGGALDALHAGVERLADALEHQQAAAGGLRDIVRGTYAAALSTVEHALADGTLLRGDALVRWRQFVEAGGLGTGGLAHRIRAVLGNPDPPAGRLLAALEAALVTLVVEVAAEADDRIRTAWSADPAGAALLAGADIPGRVAAGRTRTDRVLALVRDWLDGVRQAAGAERVALLVVLRVLGVDEAPGRPDTGTLVHRSRADLLARIAVVLDAGAATFTTLLADAGDAAATAQRLRAAVRTGAAE
jgi:hypothetical protein